MGMVFLHKKTMLGRMDRLHIVKLQREYRLPLSSIILWSSLLLFASY